MARNVDRYEHGRPVRKEAGCAQPHRRRRPPGLAVKAPCGTLDTSPHRYSLISLPRYLLGQKCCVGARRGEHFHMGAPAEKKTSYLPAESAASYV